MKCQVCGEVDATIHFKELKDDGMQELHMCAACASEKGFHLLVEQQKASLSNKLVWMAEHVYPEGLGELGTLQCPHCALRFSDFSRMGRLGCGECYAAFDAPLRRILRRVHGSTRHAGKTPGAAPVEATPRQRLHRLQDELQQAIMSEDYEGAARLRDTIRELERQLTHEGPKA